MQEPENERDERSRWPLITPFGGWATYILESCVGLVLINVAVLWKEIANGKPAWLIGVLAVGGIFVLLGVYAAFVAGVEED